MNAPPRPRDRLLHRPRGGASGPLWEVVDRGPCEAPEGRAFIFLFPPNSPGEDEPE